MRLFFIVGAQKSGTTWLQRSLNSIEGICCLGEGHFIDRLAIPIVKSTRSYNKMMNLVADRVYEGNGFYQEIPDTEFLDIMRQWIIKILIRNSHMEAKNILAIGDKTPANSLHINDLHALFPEANFIHMLRDGRDVAVSAFHHESRIMRKLSESETLDNINDQASFQINKWAQYTRAVLQAEANGHSMHTVRYEDMLINPIEALLGCLHHIVPDNEWNHSVIQTAVDANSFQRQSGRNPGQVSTDSFLRKGQAGSWREELDPSIFGQMQKDDQSLLEQLGYTD